MFFSSFLKVSQNTKIIRKVIKNCTNIDPKMDQKSTPEPAPRKHQNNINPAHRSGHIFDPKAEKSSFKVTETTKAR